MTKHKSKPKRNHHELPELYLKSFCEENTSFLWVYRRGRSYSPGLHRINNNPYRFGVRVATRQRDRYAVVTPEGHTDFETYENRLQKEEHGSDHIFHKMRSQMPISHDEKEIFARYIQLMLKRVSTRDKATLAMVSGYVNSVPWRQIGLQLSVNGQFGTARRLFEAEKYLTSDKAGKRYLLNESMLALYPQLHAELSARKWTFYMAPTGTYFVTSDDPVTYDKVDGLHKSPLIFPISSNLVMVATRNGSTDLQYIKASLDEALTINYLVICYASKVYSPKPDRWVWDILDHGLDLNENQSLALKELFTLNK